MSRGLGKLQRFILKTLNDPTWYKPGMPTIGSLYEHIIHEYWDTELLRGGFKFHEVYAGFYSYEDMPEVNRRRASIAQSLRSLKKREYIGMDKLFGNNSIWITHQGREAIRNYD